MWREDGKGHSSPWFLMAEDRNEGKPSWKIRRKFFAYTIGFASFIMLYVILRWEDLMIANELIGFATAVWLAVLGFYTSGATYEDVRLYTKNKEIDYEREYTK